MCCSLGKVVAIGEEITRGNCLSQVVRLLKHGIGAILRIVYHYLLRAGGASIGKDTMISLGAKIDLRRGGIYIGDYCTITHGVVILSRDAAAMLGKKRARI
jgi:acetyltransferase-like isoleucine patch superfamily enzyme